MLPLLLIYKKKKLKKEWNVVLLQHDYNSIFFQYLLSWLHFQIFSFCALKHDTFSKIGRENLCLWPYKWCLLIWWDLKVPFYYICRSGHIVRWLHQKWMDGGMAILVLADDNIVFSLCGAFVGQVKIRKMKKDLKSDGGVHVWNACVLFTYKFLVNMVKKYPGQRLTDLVPSSFLSLDHL